MCKRNDETWQNYINCYIDSKCFSVPYSHADSYIDLLICLFAMLVILLLNLILMVDAAIMVISGLIGQNDLLAQLVENN